MEAKVHGTFRAGGFDCCTWCGQVIDAERQRDELLAALRAMLYAADDLTDGQIDPNAGVAEREFIAAREAARAAIAKASS